MCRGTCATHATDGPGGCLLETCAFSPRIPASPSHPRHPYRLRDSVGSSRPTSRTGNMFGMPTPRFGSISVIVDDVAAAARFLANLGVELEPTLPEWAGYHRSFAADVSDFDADIDSPSFASWWGGVPSDGATRFVVNLSVDAREDVDRVHRQGIGAGAVELKSPFDAFWGARYAVM